MTYQTFGSSGGDSRSVEKLHALALPALKGARVLDVGCNEGFFCGYAVARGAASVVGIDQDPQVIEAARARFPGVEFLACGWDTLPEDRFDVVLLLSALHYADDQEALLHGLMTRVGPDGLLILEIGIAPGDSDEWVEVERADGPKHYATRKRVERVLAEYAFKILGPSVNQQGDSVDRQVVHVRHMKPTVLLLSSASYTGKSTLARTFAASGVPVRSLDDTLVSMFDFPPPGALGEAVWAMTGTRNPGLQGKLIVEELFGQGLGGDLLAHVMAGAKGLTILDGCLPEGSAEEVARLLAARGWIVWAAASPFPDGAHAMEPSDTMVLSVGGELAFRSDGFARVVVDAASLSHGTLSAAGWAVDLQTRQQAGSLALFGSGTERPTALRRVRRKDLVELGIAVEGCDAGFELRTDVDPATASAILSGTMEAAVVVVVGGRRAAVADLPAGALGRDSAAATLRSTMPMERA